MVTRLPPVDAVLVGFGWTGAIIGQQLCDEGLNVLALERGVWRDTPTDFAPTFAQDELRYMWRHHLFQNVAYDTLTVRNNVNQEALPMRHLGAFLLGTGVGGSGVHWNGQIWRFLESDLKAYSHNLQRYGEAAVKAHDMTVQDYPVTWDEIEPYYDMFDKICGTSGKAGNLRGQIQAGGNPFEGPRSDEYPNPPMQMPYGPTLFAEAAQRMAHRGNYLDLDPTYRDSFGRPMLRMTFDFTENELKMSRYLVDKAAGIGLAMEGASGIKKNYRTGSFNVVPYNTGGTITGDNPKTSVVNKYLQSWDVPNLFVMGSGAFPQNAGYNPTATVAALAYHAAAAIKSQYLKNPGPLVPI